jgi:hypothetical protein
MNCDTDTYPVHSLASLAFAVACTGSAPDQGGGLIVCLFTLCDGQELRSGGHRRLRAAAIDKLIVCLDEERNVGEDALPQGSRLVPYKRRIDAAAVLRIIESETPRP